MAKLGRKFSLITLKDKRDKHQDEPEVKNRLTDSCVDKIRQRLLDAAEVGSVRMARRCLLEHPQLNCDFVDYLGRPPIVLAASANSYELVCMLVDRSNLHNVYEALLIAIDGNKPDIAKFILGHQKYSEIEEKAALPSSDWRKQNPNSNFQSYITPLILAAQRNQYEIVLHLLAKNQVIETPHPHLCLCEDCIRESLDDPLLVARARLETYKALASDSYICLHSDDPIIYAFKLRRTLKDIASTEIYFVLEYEGLRENLAEFTVRLLDKVATSQELETILNYVDENVPDTYERLARLHLAISYDETRFVAHDLCQQKLGHLWCGGITESNYTTAAWLTQADYPRSLMLIFLLVISYPFLALIYLVRPSSKVGTFLRIPAIKFTCHTISQVVFIILLIFLSSVTFAGEEEHLDDKHQNIVAINLTTNNLIRRHTASPVIYLVWLWIVGLLVGEMRQLYREGFSAYSGSIYNHFDFVMLVLYITSFVLHIVVETEVEKSITYFKGNDSLALLRQGDRQAVYRLYWLTPDRSKWDALDPTILIEGLFSLATVLSFVRFSYIFTAWEMLGKLQISLTRMMLDTLRFMVVLGLLLGAFVVGLGNLYWYYDPDIRRMFEGGIDPDVKVEAGDSFGKPHRTFKTIFWALFGMGGPDAPEIQGYPFVFTVAVGYFLYGVYMFAAVVISLNMLIAMMSNTYQRTENNAMIEWRFARTQLFMEYIKEGSTLPVPLNLIPTPKIIFKLLSQIRCCCGRTKVGSTILGEEMSEIKNFSRKVAPDVTPAQYRAVMKNVVKRVVIEDNQNSAKEDNSADELKQEFATMKADLIDKIDSLESAFQDKKQEDKIRLKTIQEDSSSSDHDLTLLHGKLDETSKKLLAMEKILSNLEKFSLKMEELLPVSNYNADNCAQSQEQKAAPFEVDSTYGTTNIKQKSVDHNPASNQRALQDESLTQSTNSAAYSKQGESVGTGLEDDTNLEACGKVTFTGKYSDSQRENSDGSSIFNPPSMIEISEHGPKTNTHTFLGTLDNENTKDSSYSIGGHIFAPSDGSGIHKDVPVNFNRVVKTRVKLSQLENTGRKDKLSRTAAVKIKTARTNPFNRNDERDVFFKNVSFTINQSDQGSSYFGGKI